MQVELKVISKAAFSALSLVWTDSFLVAGCSDRAVRIFSVFRSEGPILVSIFEGPQAYPVEFVSCSRNASLLGCCGKDRCGFVWDVECQKLSQKLFGHEKKLTCICFNDAGNLAFTGSSDCTVRIFDLRSKNPTGLQKIRDFKDDVTGIIEEGCEILTTSTDGILRTFDVRNCEVRKDETNLCLSGLCLSEDGERTLISAVNPGLAFMIDRRSGHFLKSFSGHKNDEIRIPSCFVGVNGLSYVCTGSENGELFLFSNLTSEMVLRKTIFTQNALSSIASSTNHPTVATASYGGEILMHALSTKQTISDETID